MSHVLPLGLKWRLSRSSAAPQSEYDEAEQLSKRSDGAAVVRSGADLLKTSFRDQFTPED